MGLHGSREPTRPPGWTWAAAAALLLAAREFMGTGAFLASPAVAGLDLTLGLGIALIHWWGPRVLAAWVGVVVARHVLGAEHLGPAVIVGLVEAAPTATGLFLSWLLFARLGGGQCWLPTRRDLVQFLVLGLAVPVLAAVATTMGLERMLVALGVDAPSPAPWLLEATALVLGRILAGLALSMALLAFGTAVLEARGWTATRGAAPLGLLPTGMGWRTEAPLMALILGGMFGVTRLAPFEGVWFVFGLFVFIAAMRWGLGMATLGTTWGVALTLLSPWLLTSELYGEGDPYAHALIRSEAGLVVFCVCAAVVGRTIEDWRRESARRLDEEGRTRLSEMRLAESQRVGRVGSWEFNSATGHVWWSAELYHLLGLDPATFTPSYEAFLELLVPEDRERTAAEVEAAFAAGRPFVIEHRVRHADGSIVVLTGKAQVVADFEGRPTRLVGHTQDVTERRREEAERERLETALRDSQRLESLGVLAGGVAHDFNNLLVGVLTNAELARRRLAVVDDAEAVREADEGLARIADAAEQAARLTQQLLAYAGRSQVEMGAVDLGVQVEAVARLVESSLPRGVRLERAPGDDVAPIRADAGQVDQVLLNAILNAAESFPEGTSGTITVTTRVERLDAERAAALRPHGTAAPGPYAVVQVTDTGGGMDGQTLERMFEPFYSTKAHGRGLGLAACLGIVRRHGGGLEVTSEAGTGTVFRLLLPAVPADRPTQEPAPGAPAPERLEAGRPLSVLVVDDVAEVRTAVGLGLTDHGHRAVAVGTGEEAVARLAAESGGFDVVVLDLTMPGMDGEETLGRLRELAPGLPVVFVSGYDVRARLGGDHEAGRRHFLQKPFRLDELLDACVRAAGPDGERPADACASTGRRARPAPGRGEMAGA